MVTRAARIADFATDQDPETGGRLGAVVPRPRRYLSASVSACRRRMAQSGDRSDNRGGDRRLSNMERKLRRLSPRQARRGAIEIASTGHHLESCRYPPPVRRGLQSFSSVTKSWQCAGTPLRFNAPFCRSSTSPRGRRLARFETRICK